MGRTKPGAGAKIRLPGQGAQPPSLILCEILKVCSATADYVRFTPKSGHCGARPACPLCAKSGHRATSA